LGDEQFWLVTQMHPQHLRGGDPSGRCVLMSRDRQKVTVLFQDYMHHDMAAEENIALGDLTALEQPARTQGAATRARIHDRSSLPRVHVPAVTLVLLRRARRPPRDHGHPRSGAPGTGGRHCGHHMRRRKPGSKRHKILGGARVRTSGVGVRAPVGSANPNHPPQNPRPALSDRFRANGPVAAGVIRGAGERGWRVWKI
jgi:hypothetical protein